MHTVNLKESPVKFGHVGAAGHTVSSGGCRCGQRLIHRLMATCVQHMRSEQSGKPKRPMSLAPNTGIYALTYALTQSIP